MAINGIMMQYFEWYLGSGYLWKQLKEQAGQLADEGVTSVWIPPAYKGDQGQYDVGYTGYDIYDLGEFDQKGSVATKYGTKDELLSAIRALHEKGIHVYADVVLDHKIGADGIENVIAREHNPHNRNEAWGNYIKIKAWTLFTFPGRNGKYSDFTWNWTHFDATDWDAKDNREGIFLFAAKEWNTSVSGEKGNYDYLMGADVDLDDREVVNELRKWGRWFVQETGVDGFRFDAVKHMRFSFFKRWLKELRRLEGKELFSVGEYWNADINELKHYLNETAYEFSLFDVPLHYKFYQASNSNGYFDMRTIFDNTLTSHCPEKSVTFVDNHDSQPGQSLESFVLGWFKPLAYAMILLRKEGYPCVFYGDYYGIPNNNIPAGRQWLAPMMAARRLSAYGAQHDYFDSPDLVGWTREGDDEHPGSGLAVVLTDSSEGSKHMYVGARHANARFRDVLGGFADPVTIGGDGCAVFPVHGGSVSVWRPMD